MSTTGNPVIGLDVALSLEKMRAELKKIPGYATPEGKAMAAALDKSARQMAASMAKPAKAAKAAAKEAETAWSKAGGALSALAKGSGYGDIVEKFGNIGKAGALAGPEVVALGVAAAALAAPFAAAIAATAALEAGLVGAAFAGKGALKELEGFKAIGSDFYPVVPPETIASFDRLAAAGTGLVSIYDKLTVEVGANTAPAVEHLTDVVIGAALAAEQSFAAWSQGKDLFVELDKLLIESALIAFLPLTDAVRGLGRGYIALADLIGRDVDPATRAAMASTEGLRDALLAQDEALGANLGSLDGLAASGRAFLDDQVRATAATGKHAGAVKDDTDAQAKLTAELLKQASAAQAAADKFAAHMAAVEGDAKAADDMVEASGAFRLSEIEKLAAARDKAEAEYVARAQEGGKLQSEIDAGVAQIAGNYQEQITAKAAEEAAKRDADAQASADNRTAMERQVATQIAGYAANAASQIAASFAASSEQAQENAAALSERLEAGDKHYTKAQKAELQARVEHQRQAALKAFHASQAAAMVTAAINTALAVSQALASSPPPLSYALAIASGAAGLLEEAAIASQSPPSFHSGTADTAPYAPDEYTARMRTGEAVANPTGADQIGRNTIAAANAGVAPQTARMEVHMHYRSRDLDPVLSDTYRRGGAFQRTISSNQAKPTGHR